MKLTEQIKTPEDWKKITKKELYELTFKQNLPDSIIADMYGVSQSAVTYKRRVKFGLKVTIDSDAFRQSCKESVIEYIKEAKGISAEYKELALKAVRSYYKDLKEIEF